MAGFHVRSVLVTGSNRGIGLELIKHFTGKLNPPEVIFATCRDPEGVRAQELKNLASKHPNVVILQLEATDSASIKSTAKKAEAHLGGTGLNLLINNAGIMPPSTLESATPEDMLSVYNTNVVGPLLVTQAFLPLLKKAALGSNQKGMSCSKAAIVNISSVLGSIEKTPELFSFVPVVSYRCSKAALNMLTKCQSMGYKQDGILCTALHPGWVKTELGNFQPNVQADLTVDESVSGLMKVICDLSEKHHGVLLSWEGNTLPW
ncbi:C-signal-like [Chelonoidis abingdonii]|uniref:C-signal-like n=1 Tax=Chelonoidis abingdonii TaxID=106734 RepID=UPI0013F1F97A|nr:C-factor-like [Chelonoidis abingdonii]